MSKECGRSNIVAPKGEPSQFHMHLCNEGYRFIFLHHITVEDYFSSCSVSRTTINVRQKTHISNLKIYNFACKYIKQWFGDFAFLHGMYEALIIHSSS